MLAKGVLNPEGKASNVEDKVGFILRNLSFLASNHVSDLTYSEVLPENCELVVITVERPSNVPLFLYEVISQLKCNINVKIFVEFTV